MAGKAALYYYTVGDFKRPRIVTKQIDQLTKYAKSLGYDTTELFLDKTCLKEERTEFVRFTTICHNFEALITKDFYHIAKNTGSCMDILNDLEAQGIKIFSIEDGAFQGNKAPFGRPLKIATYTSYLDSKIKPFAEVSSDVLQLFTAKKTCWSVIDQYIDTDPRQPLLTSLIQNREKYDMVVVPKMIDIHWRTTTFCKLRRQLQKDIYSLQEGFLTWDTPMKSEGN